MPKIKLILSIILLTFLFSSCTKKSNELLEEEINNKLSTMPSFPYEVYDKWEEVEKPLSSESEDMLKEHNMFHLKEIIENKEHEYQMNIGYSFSIIQEWIKGIDIEDKVKKIKRITPLNKTDFIILNQNPKVIEEIDERFKLFQEINEELVSWLESIN